MARAAQGRAGGVWGVVQHSIALHCAALCHAVLSPHPLPHPQVHTHSAEGFALDWSPVAAGRLASGDCRSRIHVWEPSPAGGRAGGREGVASELMVARPVAGSWTRV